MNERIKTFEEKMKKTIGNLDGELSAIRADFQLFFSSFPQMFLFFHS